MPPINNQGLILSIKHYFSRAIVGFFIMHIFCYGLKSYKKPQPDIANIQTVFLKTKFFNHNLLFIYKKIDI